MRIKVLFIIETLYEVSIVFRKESFINAKKVLNFIQSLTNEKKGIKSLTAFHMKQASTLRWWLLRIIQKIYEIRATKNVKLQQSAYTT